jgi:ketosteroid isomerase-like protein
VQKPLRVLAVLFLAALPVLSRAQVAEMGDAQLREVLQQRYAAMKSAMATRDAKAIAALLAPDFESVDVNGKTETADQMVQQVVALPQDPDKTSDTTIVSVARSGTKATVVQRYHMTTTKTGPAAADSHTIDLLATSTDTWLDANGVWLLQRTVTDQLDYSIDGKVVAHKERPKQP